MVAPTELDPKRHIAYITHIQKGGMAAGIAGFCVIAASLIPSIESAAITTGFGIVFEALRQYYLAQEARRPTSITVYWPDEAEKVITELSYTR